MQQPTDIVCIEVPKVYDFCFQAERRENICTPIRKPCPIPPDATVRCTITATTCEEVARSTPTPDGRANVTLAITVTYTLEVLDNTGRVILTIPDLTFGFVKAVVLCAPTTPFPTTTVCNIVSSSCFCLIAGEQICCTFDLCIVIQSVAVVKLLVPSFGFCVPALCEEVAPGPPFVCPPQLFPPQCPPLRNE
ncbi:MAG: hypothetical protein K6U74_15600 [Firmicutes bacterium]|nr:hypothetical protein [Bacillota bacterium]